MGTGVDEVRHVDIGVVGKNSGGGFRAQNG